jgi:hypothetical protein
MNLQSVPAALWGWLADLALLGHLGFLLFVAFGALLVGRRPWIRWVHLPAFAWGALIELAGWICPLTPLEVAWRVRAGQAGYQGGFIDHYVTAILYPDGLTRPVQVGLGIAVLVWNGFLYWRILGPGRRLSPGAP